MPLYTCAEKNIKILFIHIPKCGGGSIEKFFRMNGFTQHLFSVEPELITCLKCSPQHFHSELIISQLNISKVNYSFAIFRDPVERMISEYRWRIKHPLAVNGFDSWYQAIRQEFKENKYLLDNHIRCQVDFLIPNLNVFRFEDGLELALREMATHLGLTLNFDLLENQKYQSRLQSIKGDVNLENLYANPSPSSKTINKICNDYHDDIKFYTHMTPFRSTKVVRTQPKK